MKRLPFFLITLLFLAACQNDDEPTNGPLTSDQAIASIDQTTSQVSEDIIDLIQSDGLESAFQASEYIFYFVDYGNAVRSDNTREKLLELVRAFAIAPASRISTANQTGSFPTGVYEWNSTEQDFIFSEEADVLILKFPIGASETNNGKFTLTSLDFSDSDLPELVEMNLTVNDVLMVDLYLAINWSSLGLPEVAELYLFLNPFSFNLGLNLTDGLGTSLTFAMSKGDEQIAGIGLTTSTGINDIYNGTLPEVDGYIEYRGLKLDGAVDLAGLEDAFQNETDPNEAIEVYVLVQGETVGQIVLVLETNEGYTDYYPYVEFNDGTLISLEDLAEDMITEIEAELDGINM